MSNYNVFFVPGKHGIIDYALERDGVFVGAHGKTQAELAVEYPGIEVGDLTVVHAAQQTALKTAPVLITRERFVEMLEVLPPENWSRGEGSESFKLCEYYSGNITRIYARIGKQYYEFMDDAGMPHAEIVQKIAASLAPAVTH